MKNSPASSKRPSRAKRNFAWEQIVIESHGFYAENLHKISTQFPELTPAELRVCTLVKAMLYNWQIAEKLAITESSVERCRLRIRRKLGLQKENLVKYLISH